MCLGADDRCGVCMALALYEEFPDDYTIFFTDQEERGHGYNTAELSTHSIWNGKFVICLDSTERNVFSFHAPLEKALEHLNKRFNFHWEKKSLSNLQYMSGSVGINLGMGYSKQHTPEEYIKISVFRAAYQYCLSLTKLILGQDS